MTRVMLAAVAVAVGDAASSFWWMIGACIVLGFLWAVFEADADV